MQDTIPESVHLTRVSSPHPCQFTSPVSLHLTRVCSPHPCLFTSPVPRHLTRVCSPHLDDGSDHVKIFRNHLAFGASF